MDFGRLTDTDFDSLDFSLPAEPDFNKEILSKAPTAKTKFFAGCAKWGRKDWVGSIYPPGTKEADFLNHYGKHFNSIELNASFYRMPSNAQTSSWRKKVPADFIFCPKVTGQLSHVKRLKDIQEQLERFINGISGFGKNLGPVLLMPHPGMGPKTLPLIETFSRSLPPEMSLFVELRHESWFVENNKQQMLNSFADNNIGLVITDVAGRRDCAHMTLTVPKAFIRFNGNGLHPTDYKRIDEWVTRIDLWQQQGIHEVYFFMHQHDERHSPVLCKYLVEKLNEVCHANLPVPEFVGTDIVN
ncbi:MAG TPA: DUF72 domain-containing protein [Chryseosolibacter sp.]|nr:DUF72 domain-containing protein [Chryseosolibacter sp.]